MKKEVEEKDLVREYFTCVKHEDNTVTISEVKEYKIPGECICTIRGKKEVSLFGLSKEIQQSLEKKSIIRLDKNSMKIIV